ncbi:MAG: hypothetical protein FJ290_09220 [Planctomycetes bacterium]|nr:hypothetical protein [Planctomycetota bacterium]
MSGTIHVDDLTDEEVSLVKGFVQLLRGRHSPSASDADREGDWGHLAAASFAEGWDNDQDATYDNWRDRYAVPVRQDAI